MKRVVTISRRWVRVWQRNLKVYRQTWKISFLPPLLEPIFYLAAFGIGLGSLVGDFTYGSSSIAYLPFFAPALVAITIMYNAFFETSYASFVRMYYQKTFDAMLATPLTLEEVIIGEITWAATKSVIAAFLMQIVISLAGLVQYPSGLLLPAVAVLGGLAFAAIGMVFTSLVPNIETFNLPIFLFVTPMFLFSGTFFPLQNLPIWAQWLACLFPLTHLTLLVRACALNSLAPSLIWSLFYLLTFFLITGLLALRGMHKRLIK
jgi:lipooligosaccharide transport system permease protein